jgi:hypothetical protein
MMKMRADTLIPVLFSIVALMALSPVAQGKKAGRMPDPDLLDYLGTFETDSGKEIDSMLLDSMPVAKHVPIKATTKKGKAKRNESPKKEEKR